MFNTWVLLVIVFFIALLLTWLLRRYALANSVIDIPNQRSSHKAPTPRGGGVAIVVGFLLGLLAFGFYGELPWRLVWGLFGSGLLIAILGFLDDHGHIAARWRLLGHFTAAIWALFFLNGLPELQIAGLIVDLGWIGYILAAFYIVWLLNLYNFMDGIDGLASLEAIFVCLGGSLLFVLIGAPDNIFLPLLLAAAVAGFLFWNFPPARIFMGDAGSGFLGITLAVLSIQAAWVNTNLLYSWLILLGVFIVDSTYTLFKRLFRGEKVYEAHRSHAYQFASRKYGSHKAVTLGIGLINLVWLLPIALLVGAQLLDSVVGLVVAYIPLVFLAVKFKAGQAE